MTTQTENKNALSMERAISINFLRSSGSLAVKCIKGSKAPAKGYDPRSNNQESTKRVIDDVEFSDDNFGLHLTGPMVDVDVDTDNPVLFHALDAFLPDTPHIWGRAAKPRSHRVYQLRDETNFNPGEYPLLQRLKRTPEAQMELRGGPVSRGEYSVMPGSTHPSGEMYTWDSIAKARSTPALVSLNSVMDGMRKAAAVAVLAPCWTEGVRQEMTMALAGFLYRLTILDETAEETGAFQMLFDDSITFLKVLLDAVDDDPEDRKDRIAAFKKTWKKAEEGLPVTGATRIGEVSGDPQIVRKLYALLSDNPDVQKLENFLQRFAIWVGPGSVIDMELASKGVNDPIMSRPGFINSYGHEFMMVNKKQRLIADALFSMSNATRVAGLTFHPAAGRLVDTRVGTKVNLWGGYEIQPHPSPVDDAAMKPFTEYVFDILANGREELGHWIMAWCADIFQRPAKKAGTALVLVGLPGAGKTFLGENILIPILGENAGTATNDLETVTQKHNTNTSNRLFIQCNEATNSRQKMVTARLKSLITDAYRTIEPKNVNAFTVPDFTRYNLTSNDITDAIHLPDGLADRRFTIAHVNEDRVGQEKEYWLPFLDWCGNNLAKIHKYLLDYKYDPVILRRCLTTKEKIKMAAASWGSLDQWIAGSIADGFPLPIGVHTSPKMTHDHEDDNPVEINRGKWPRFVTTRALSSAMAHYNPRGGHGMDPNSAHVRLLDMGLATENAFKKLVVEVDERTGSRAKIQYKFVEIASLEQFKKYASEKFGYESNDARSVDGGYKDEEVEF